MLRFLISQLHFVEILFQIDTERTGSPFPYLASTGRMEVLLQAWPVLGTCPACLHLSSLAEKKFLAGKGKLRSQRVSTSLSSIPDHRAGCHHWKRRSLTQLQCSSRGVLPSGKGRP